MNSPFTHIRLADFPTTRVELGGKINCLKMLYRYNDYRLKLFFFFSLGNFQDENSFVEAVRNQKPPCSKKRSASHSIKPSTLTQVRGLVPYSYPIGRAQSSSEAPLDAVTGLMALCSISTSLWDQSKIRLFSDQKDARHTNDKMLDKCCSMNYLLKSILFRHNLY